MSLPWRSKASISPGRVMCRFFFSASRQPPQPTLFAYTTLFRSEREGQEPRARSVEQPSPVIVPTGNGGSLDRKSTRLNSSHMSTSYAVFCLKKKNQTAHFLVTDLGDVLTLAFKGLNQSGTCNVQILFFSIAAATTANALCLHDALPI